MGTPIYLNVEEAPTEALAQERLALERVEDYLDHLCAPLVGIVPYPERNRLRLEAGYNIEGRMRTYILDGMDPLRAAERAIRKYGRSDAICEQFLTEWVRYQPQGWLARRLGTPNLYALFFFGQATLWGLVMVLVQVYYPTPEPETFGLTFDQVRHLLPEPLPLPDRNPLFVAFWIYLFFAPFLAGLLTGMRVPVGAAKATLRVMGLLVIVSFAVGSQLWPAREGNWLAMGQLFWWMGVGTCTAHLTSVIVRRRKFRFRVSPVSIGELDEPS